MTQKEDLEIHSFILLGKTGAGKSTLYNNIAKETKFEVGDSFNSCTSEISFQIIIYKNEKSNSLKMKFIDSDLIQKAKKNKKTKNRRRIS